MSRCAPGAATTVSRAARSTSLDDLVEGARRVRAAYWEQFQIGKRSIIDLLNAENETYQARLSAITERLELIQVRYRLLGSLAGLTGYLGIEPAIPVAEPDSSAAANACRCSASCTSSERRLAAASATSCNAFTTVPL